jgi:hypothetical protein
VDTRSAILWRRRFQQLQLNYVWGKGLGFDDDYFAIDPRLNYGPNDFDRTHRLIVFNVLEIPVGKGKPLLGNSGRVINSLVGGWSLTSITNWSSGLPFSLTYIGSECTNDRDTGPCRPNMVGTVQILKDRTEYFTTTGGESLASGTATQPGKAIGPWQRPTVGTFGNTTRNSLRGPGLLNTDLVILKDLGIGERYVAQFRVEFANVFNRSNLGNPNGCVDCPEDTAGAITNLARGASQRQIGFALHLQF